jgi:hypothetical protein
VEKTAEVLIFLFNFLADNPREEDTHAIWLKTTRQRRIFTAK